MEKVSSYFPPPLPSLSHPSLPVQYSPPKHLPIPDPLLPSIFFIAIIIPRAIPDHLCASPTPSAHRVHPPGTSIPTHPSLRYCYSLVLLSACPVVLLDFCCESHFDLCTYAALSQYYSLASPALLSFSSPTLRMQCHISFVTSPNYPFVFCNHKFFLTLIAFACHLRR